MAKKRPVMFERKKSPHFRLVVKMNGMAWPINPNFFHDVLISLGYQNIMASDDRSLRATKPSHAFSSHVPGLLFRFDSDRSNSLLDAQREFSAVLARNYKTCMENHVAYYEMGYTCEYILDEPVSATYAKILDGSDVKSLFESVTGKNLVLDKLELSSGSRIDVTDWYSVEISTRVESSGNTLFCNMQRVSSNLKEIYKTAKNASETINSLVDGLTAAR